MHILAKVFDGVVAGTSCLNIGDPVDFPEGFDRVGREQSPGLEGEEHEGAAAIGQHLCVNQEAAGAQRVKAALGVEADAGNDKVDMRMVEHILSPGLQEPEEAALVKTGMFGIGQDLFEGLGSSREEKPVEQLGTAIDVFAQVGWKGEGDHEVGNRQQLL